MAADEREPREDDVISLTLSDTEVSALLGFYPGKAGDI